VTVTERGKHLQSLLIATERGFWSGDAAFLRNEHRSGNPVRFRPDRRNHARRRDRCDPQRPVLVRCPFRSDADVRLADDVAMLTDTRPLASSVYLWRGNTWKLAFRGQTPL
jgi:hypothetical protein